MVDVEFKSRAKHFVPLSVLKGIAAGDTPEYLTTGDVDAIKGHFTRTMPSPWLIADARYSHAFRDGACQPWKVKRATSGANSLGRHSNDGGQRGVGRRTDKEYQEPEEADAKG